VLARGTLIRWVFCDLVWFTLSLARVHAQSISTYAGSGTPDGVTALGAGLRSISSIAPLPSGNIYYTSEGKLFRIDPTGTLTIVRNNFAGHVASEASGTMLVSDAAAGIVTRLDTHTGQTTTVAGSTTGSGCPQLQNQPATAAVLCEPSYAVSDSRTVLYINSQVDSACGRISAISRVAASMITTIAVADCLLRLPDQPLNIDQFGPLAVDAGGNLFFVRITTTVPGGEYQFRETISFSASIMELLSTSTMAVVYAGNGSFGFSGDGGPATGAQLNNPTSITVGPDKFLYIADFQNHRIRRIDPSSGTITTFGGNASGNFVDGVSPDLTRFFPTAISFLGSDLLVADGDLIRRISGATGLVETIAGSISVPASHIRVTAPVALAVDRSSNVIVADQDIDESVFLPVGNLAPANRVRKIDRVTGSVKHLAGDFSGIESGSGGAAAQAGTPVSSIASDPSDRTYIVKQTFPSTARMVDSSGQISEIAGIPGAFVDPGGGFVNCGGPMPEQGCPVGDGGPAQSAYLTGTVGVATDNVGNLFLCDGTRVREVDAISQIISTIAGTGTSGDSGDGGPATDATISCSALAVNLQGNVLVSEPFYHRVRIIDKQMGVIGPYAGNGTDGYAGDGGPATAATLSTPNSIAIDTGGNVYISDGGNGTVRRVNFASGLISTVAGNGTIGFSGDGGPATAAVISPSSIVTDGFGNLFIAESANARIRVVSQLAQAAVSPLHVYFGAQTVGTVSSPQTVTVSNGGTTTLNIQSVMVKGDSASDFIIGDRCSGQNLDGVQSCSVDVLFKPLGSQARSAWIAMTASGGNYVELSLGGLGRDFELSAMDTTATVKAGQSGVYRMTVAPVVGFMDTVSLSCAGLPDRSSCSFDKGPSLTLDGKNPVTVTLTIQTTASVVARSTPQLGSPSSSVLRAPPPVSVPRPTQAPRILLLRVSLAGICIVSLTFLLEERRSCPVRVLCVLVWAGTSLLFTACGGGSSGTSNSGGGSPGTQAGSYTVTVSGSVGSGLATLTHNANVVLVVQ
jgi:hypothetical protein